MRASFLTALVLLCLAWSGSARPTDAAGPQADTADDADTAGPLMGRYRQLERPREWDSRIGPPDPDEPDWNPLSAPAWWLKGALSERGIRLDLSTAFYGEFATITTDEANVGTFAWELVGDGELLHHEKLGTSYLQATLLGGSGFNFDPAERASIGAAGVISGPNANIYPDDAALDELLWKQVSPGGRLVVLAGRVDPSTYFDTNRAANDAYGQFFSLALQNDLSIPFPTYGGLGAVVRAAPRQDLYLMVAALTSLNEDPWAFWRSADDGNWMELLEVGFSGSLPYLGTGRYRITPWHNRLDGSDGFGISLNFDQELGHEQLVAFFRFGIGDDDVTPIERFLSGGLAFEQPFDRAGDMVALGAASSDPSPDNGVRRETLLELYYRLGLSPTISLTPDLQVIFDPADGDSRETILVWGIRLEMSF
jgi:carbohydrate-selective porin OprB